MLILKNEIKVMFRANGMPSGLTVSRNNTTRFISISGECGDPILTVSKVEIGYKLTKAERKIIIDDYIEPALLKNKADILEYIKLKKDTSAQDELDRVLKEYKTLSITAFYKGSREVKMRSDDDSLEIILRNGKFYLRISYLELDKMCEKKISSFVSGAKDVLLNYLKALDDVDNHNELLKIQQNKLVENCGF